MIVSIFIFMFAHKYKDKMFADHDKMDYLNSHFSYVKHNDQSGNRIDFRSTELAGSITYDPIHDTYLIMGIAPLNQTIQYWAANPVFQNGSDDGSGLPYPNPETAYENTPSYGVVPTRKGYFQITIRRPSQYYVKQGKILLKPHIHFVLTQQNKVMTLILGESIPNRSLTSLPKRPNRVIGR